MFHYFFFFPFKIIIDNLEFLSYKKLPSICTLLQQCFILLHKPWMTADKSGRYIITLAGLVTAIIPSLTLGVEHTLVYTVSWRWGSGGIGYWCGYSVGGHGGVAWHGWGSHNGLWGRNAIGEWCWVDKVTVWFLTAWVGWVLNQDTMTVQVGVFSASIKRKLISLISEVQLLKCF